VWHEYLGCARRVCLAISASLALMACGSALPKPNLAPHPPDAYVEVPYPPPAAAAEIVPPKPHPDAVWIDGQWSWRGRYFVWQRGGWVVPPPNAAFSPWARAYGKRGTLYFADAAWRDKNGRRLRAPRMLRSAVSPPESETPESVTTP
jgi:hypothetical protein